MAFSIERMVRNSEGYNAGKITLADASVVNGPRSFSYATAADSAATVAGANYFNADSIIFDLAVDDLITCVCSDANVILQVTAVDTEAKTITTAAFTPAGTVNTANITDLAVTTGKLAANAVTSAKVAETLIQHAQVDVSLANFIGSYTASVELVAAPGAGKKIILHRANLWVDYGGTVLADGGAMHLQYADDANGAGTKATGTLAAATLIAATADTTFGFSPVDTTLVDSATLNEGLYLATATADFTGGTSSAYKVDVWYSVADFS